MKIDITLQVDVDTTDPETCFYQDTADDIATGFVDDISTVGWHCSLERFKERPDAYIPPNIPDILREYSYALSNIPRDLPHEKMLVAMRIVTDHYAEQIRELYE